MLQLDTKYYHCKLFLYRHFSFVFSFTPHFYRRYLKHVIIKFMCSTNEKVKLLQHFISCFFPREDALHHSIQTYRLFCCSFKNGFLNIPPSPTLFIFIVNFLQSRQMLPIVGHLLRLTPKETDLIKDTFEWKLPLD